MRITKEFVDHCAHVARENVRLAYAKLDKLQVQFIAEENVYPNLMQKVACDELIDPLNDAYKHILAATKDVVTSNAFDGNEEFLENIDELMTEVAKSRNIFSIRSSISQEQQEYISLVVYVDLTEHKKLHLKKQANHWSTSYEVRKMDSLNEHAPNNLEPLKAEKHKDYVKLDLRLLAFEQSAKIVAQYNLPAVFIGSNSRHNINIAPFIITLDDLCDNNPAVINKFNQLVNMYKQIKESEELIIAEVQEGARDKLTTEAKLKMSPLWPFVENDPTIQRMYKELQEKAEEAKRKREERAQARKELAEQQKDSLSHPDTKRGALVINSINKMLGD